MGHPGLEEKYNIKNSVVEPTQRKYSYQCHVRQLRDKRNCNTLIQMTYNVLYF